MNSFDVCSHWSAKCSTHRLDLSSFSIRSTCDASTRGVVSFLLYEVWAYRAHDYALYFQSRNLDEDGQMQLGLSLVSCMIVCALSGWLGKIEDLRGWWAAEMEELRGSVGMAGSDQEED